jgi:hypothetical protein
MQERMAMIIPTCRGMSQSQDDEHNQSITRQPMKSSDKDDTMIFFTEIHLLASMLVLDVAIHSLGGSRANWHHTPNPQ